MRVDRDVGKVFYIAGAGILSSIVYRGVMSHWDDDFLDSSILKILLGDVL